MRRQVTSGLRRGEMGRVKMILLQDFYFGEVNV